jgi:hypothetical protein
MRWTIDFDIPFYSVAGGSGVRLQDNCAHLGMAINYERMNCAEGENKLGLIRRHENIKYIKREPQSR